MLEIVRGNVTGLSSVNKFGRNTNVDATPTDLWDLSSEPIWLAPTDGRVHQVASTDVNDTDGGTGLHSLGVYGLPSWDEAETFQVIEMNGTTNVPTTPLVIIHRMQSLFWGASGPNVGTITATADTDTTITAQINAGIGQTEMAIYGVPSGKTAYLTRKYASILGASPATVRVNLNTLWNPIPASLTTGFLSKGPFGLSTAGTSAKEFFPVPPDKYQGPGILKLQALSSASNADVSGGFDLILG